MINKRKTIYAIAANVLIVLFEIIAFIMSFRASGWEALTYYTQDSNLLALFSCAIFTVFAAQTLKGKPLPQWVFMLRYMATCMLAVTFIVVIFVLIPMFGFDQALFLLFGDSMLFMHTLCPIISVLSFVLLEPQPRCRRSQIFVALIPSGMYAVIVIILNITRTMHGPYPFLYIYEQSAFMSVVWFVVIFAITALLSLALWAGNRKLASKKAS
ncbi:MAG: hypothetical protein PHX51_02650 [Clostridia bacterium]|nr:hypothetical protein [Clostridia bacterium]